MTEQAPVERDEAFPLSKIVVDQQFQVRDQRLNEDWVQSLMAVMQATAEAVELLPRSRPSWAPRPTQLALPL